MITPVSSASRAEKWRKARPANSTDAALAARPATTADPAGPGVLKLLAGGAGGWVPTHAVVVPYGAGADNSTFTLRLIGWRCVGATWLPTPLWAGTCTLSQFAGLAGGDVLDTERVADAIATTLGTDGVTCQPVSPGDNTPAHVLVDLKGCEVVEALFALGGSATAANALLAGV